ncbi:YbjN domain-containing protein [Corynebacterium mendelii]|uniref:YbjN domain-containing protein n=1 Tax=Corynebacterium mendelii TaxID=2765362 RepID=A0A939DZ79_9CORY|nr:YbjN domain-containing protein [Corynebacterium mendelii]
MSDNSEKTTPTDTIRPVTATRIKAVLAAAGVDARTQGDDTATLYTLIEGHPYRFDTTQAHVLYTVSSQLPDHALAADRFDDVLAWVTFANEATELVQVSATVFPEHGVVLSIDVPVFVPGGVTDEQLTDSCYMAIAGIRAVINSFIEVFFPGQADKGQQPGSGS